MSADPESANCRRRGSPRAEREREKRSQVAAATRAESAQPAATARGPGQQAGTPTAQRGGDPEERTAAPRPCLRPSRQVSRGHAPGSAPEPNRPRAPSPSRGEWVLTCGKKQAYPCRIGSCSRRRNRTAPSFRSSIVSLLPPSRQVKLLPVSLLSALTPSLLLQLWPTITGMIASILGA